jgi:SAM-dependent methyltransferase
MDSPPMTPTAWLRFDVVNRLLSSMTDIERVIEIGAGEGAVGVRLARRYAKYVGVEPDEYSNRVANARLGAVGNREASIVRSLSAVPAVAEFDLLCAFEVLEHIEDDTAALLEWRRRLKPEGWILISVPAYQGRFSESDVHSGHFRRYDPEVLRRLLHDVGFYDPDIYLYGFPLGHLLEFGRNVLARRDTKARESSIQERTASSGRWLQPSKRTGWLTKVGTAPFRLMQRPFLGSRFGIGIIARARNRIDAHHADSATSPSKRLSGSDE